MPISSTIREEGRGKGLCLLSLDAGSSRAISQLKILGEVMLRFNLGAEINPEHRPCTVFDMIGGVGSGGFIAILLVAFRMTAEEALDEFIALNANVLEVQSISAQTRTVALENYIAGLLKKHNVNKDACVMDLNNSPTGCKLAVPISYRQHVGSTCTVRNFSVRQGQALNVTIGKAILVSLAMPPLFSSTSIFKDAATFEYVGADLMLSNPIREIISEAYGCFGPGEHVACLLSIGCGHPGALSVPDVSNIAVWNTFLRKIVTDSEKEAQIAGRQMDRLGLYLRFSVDRGLDISSSNAILSPEEIFTHTTSYLSDVSLSEKLDRCVQLLKLKDGISSLEQLSHSGGEIILPPPLPSLTNPYVRRAEPMAFIVGAMFRADDFGETTRRKILAVTGIGGCGKTQIIRKFIDDYGHQFESTFFIDGSSETRLQAGLVRHVRSLGTGHSQKSFKDCISWLSQPASGLPRLIVYDNVDDPHLNILPLMPQGNGCVIVITSRNRSIGQLSPGAHLELDVMSMEEAVELLMHASDTSTQSEEQARGKARAVAEELGCLPIALAQARSYMFQTKQSADAYLKKIIAYKNRLLAEPVPHKEGMRYTSTYAAFEASFEILPERDQKLLWLFSFYHWAGFPVELVELAAQHGFSSYERQYTEPGDEFRVGKEALCDIFYQNGQFHPLNLDQMIINLQNSSLATITPGIGTRLVRMHPLAHDWVHSFMPDQERAKIQAAAVLMLALGARRNYTPFAQYLASHVSHLSPIWEQLHINDAAAFGLILHEAGQFDGSFKLRERAVARLRTHPDVPVLSLTDAMNVLAVTCLRLGRFSEAEGLQKEVIRTRTEILGEDHLDTINASNNLAVIYQELGQLSEAESLQTVVLRQTVELLGARHPDTIRASGNLATIYVDLGKHAEAEALQLDVLELRKEILGEHHPDTVLAANNLALTLCNLGRFTEAEAIQQVVVRETKELLGERHPNTITAKSNMARIYCNLGRVAEEETLRMEVLKLRKEVLGNRHPDTIQALNSVASIYILRGEHSKAEPHQREVLRLRKEVLGESHPDTIQIHHQLAVTYLNLARFSEAEEHQAEVIKQKKLRQGERHPDIISASNIMAAIYTMAGRTAEAKTLRVEILGMTRDVLGNNHPDTMDALENLALIYCDLGRVAEAEPLQEELLKSREQVLGPRHPETLKAARRLGLTNQSLGRLHEAAIIFADVLEPSKEVLGEDHPDTLEAVSNLGFIHCMLGRSEESEALLREVLRKRKELLGNNHAFTMLSTNLLVFICRIQGKLGDVEVLQMEILRVKRETAGERHPDTTKAMLDLAETYQQQGKGTHATELLNEAEIVLSETVGNSHAEYARCQEIKSRIPTS